MKRISFSVITVAITLMATSCASFERSHDSGYAYQDQELGTGRARKALERDDAAAELGFRSRELNDRESKAVHDRSALNRHEKMLEGKREREQYYRNKAYFKTDRERAEFLQIESFEARSRYLNARGIDSTSTNYSPDIQALIDINDITLGMTKQAVKESWGEPELVEVAGNPIYGNERWHYSEQLPSTEGYTTENRLVYFEGGRVAGWEKR